MIEAGARRREIDEVASELFHANGYAATSVRDIAQALDIQGASLYAHVASKEDVLWSIVDSSGDRVRAAADERARATRPAATRSTGSPPSSRPTSRSSPPTRSGRASSSRSGATSRPTAAPRSPTGATPTRPRSAT